MADIYFYQGDDPEDNEGVYGDSETTSNPDDLLPPVQKLEKYAESENIFNRQIVARTLLDTIRTVVEDPSDVDSVLSLMNKLADDIEPSVRVELMEQVPHIAMLSQEFKLQLSTVVSGHLLPMVVKFLTDANNQVRKTSQAALLVLLEQGLVEKGDVKEQVCPVIIRQTEPNSMDDYRTEAVALLSKMAPLIGKEMVEDLFLERFASLCMDPLFLVRKLCAANFGDFSSVVGSEATETVLLPKFFYLCEDGVWGVRKACADVFMPVSCVCSSSVRHAELSTLFINLLRDQSRWVRMAAFQALGPFISTFADPSITALLRNDNGEIVITEAEALAERLSALEEERLAEKEAKKAKVSQDKDNVIESTSSKSVPEVMVEPSDGNKDDDAMSIDNEDEVALNIQEEGTDFSLEEKRAEKYLTQHPREVEGNIEKEEDVNEDKSTFNSFLYWREPLVVLELDDQQDDYPESGLKIDSSLSKSLEDLRIDDESEDNSEDLNTMEMFRPRGTSSSSQSSSISTFDPRLESMNLDLDQSSYGPGAQPTDATLEQKYQDPALPRGLPQTEQDIVPQLLIDHYISMIDPSRAQTVDSEIARNCAFSLPAVALTLGRSNWPLIKDTYEILATDMQWKVRRTLASSIHELAIILGEETSATDLIPVFDGFLKDLDEVRQGLLKHMSDFLKLLRIEHRRAYLPKLADFLKMDNDRNWRFRLELAEQLERLIPLFSPIEIEEHISPIAMVLVHDKVAAVRHSATHVVATIILSLSQSDQPELAISLLTCVTSALIKEALWVHRQTFPTLCLHLFEIGAVELSIFAEKIIVHLLDMAEDKVPNVRLNVARTLSTLNQSTDYFKCAENNPFLERMNLVEMNLKNDIDVDVRSFYGGVGRIYGDTSSTTLEDNQFESLEQNSSLH